MRQKNSRPRFIIQADETQCDKAGGMVWGPNKGLLFKIYKQRKYHDLGFEC